MGNKNKIVQPVILCGGVGTRLWPLSRAEHPKQFLQLTEEVTLFQATIKRLMAYRDHNSNCLPAIIISNYEHRFIIEDELKAINATDSQVIFEPVAKNTGPAICVAALSAIEKHNDALLIVVPSDHLIGSTTEFINVIDSAVNSNSNGQIFLVGVKPVKPHTGYGYITVVQKGSGASESLFDVESFVEKPQHEQAKKLLERGNCYWNAGMFIVSARTISNSFNTLEPDLHESVSRAWQMRSICDSQSVLDVNYYANLPCVSVDNALIEKCLKIGVTLKMVVLGTSWSDLGDWESVRNSGNKDVDGNYVTGNCLIRSCHDVLVKASSRFVGVIGLENVAVIETPDAVLVVNLNDPQSVKKFVDDLSVAHPELISGNRKVHRPWGWYDTIESGMGFKVKRIQVAPGKSLSLQRHSFRAEHWVVVSGSAVVIRDDQELHLQSNESTYIPVGSVHRLSNKGSVPLEVIEIQTGSTLAEEDIERLEDCYGRTTCGSAH